MRLILQLGWFWLVLSVAGGSLCQAGEQLFVQGAGDTLRHVVQPGDSLARIAGRYRNQTRHYTFSDLLDDLRHANSLRSDLLRPGQTILVPVRPLDRHPIVADPVLTAEQMRGIYLSGAACSHSSVFDRVDQWIESGGNGVVIDAKDIDGVVTFAGTVAPAGGAEARLAPLIADLPEMLRRFRARRVYVVARIACFLDGEFGRRRPGLALLDSCGEPWRERGQVWVDPARLEVQRYNIQLAVELARAGVNEIQFDYIRFPTNGWRGDWLGDPQRTAARRCRIITEFLQQVRQALQPYAVAVSVDLFGVMAWDRLADQAITGQDIAALARYADVLCPMLYPSHYRPGFAGIARPADMPDHFVREGCRRYRDLTGRTVPIRPWLQAFPYQASSYDERYVMAQITAARDSGASGWCLWHPAGRYQLTLRLPAGRMAVPQTNLQPEPEQQPDPAASSARHFRALLADAPSWPRAVTGAGLFQAND